MTPNFLSRAVVSSVLSLSVFLFSCNSGKRTQHPEPIKQRYFDTLSISPKAEVPEYRATRTRHFDLLHTKLNLRFDWEKQHVLGEAELYLTPYFYPQQKLELDAKGFDLHSIKVNGNPSAFDYDNQLITIHLDKLIYKGDSLRVNINYTAKPNDLELGGSEAISGDKGLYFINPTGADKFKPRQIWTQGETESNSCWFPTIDSPNEKMTQDFYITVDTTFSTLSNGTLEFSMIDNGMRTDNWVQNKPHAPYLAMLAIGKYARVDESWNGKTLSYYVEPEYEAYAKQIFAHTPEMLTYFSNRLGVPYPWDKYAQVIVRDYVSGAMENTTAVIFGEFVQKNGRELYDDHNDGIVAHELFHHWFGDLVTCESWSNLPINESFATYGSCLWEEHKRGVYARDMQLLENEMGYMRESRGKQVDLIRFYYDFREDMFDAHSYSKGSVILHMLRLQVGDEAFFEALKLFLTKNAYRAVEIHELRLAFEEVTGQDMNWFFNQWFLSSGHPDLEVKKSFNSETGKLTLKVHQRQNLQTTPRYRLPLKIALHWQDKNELHEIIIEKVDEEFEFNCKQAPLWVDFDVDGGLLAKVNYAQSADELLYQATNAAHFAKHIEAVKGLINLSDTQKLQQAIVALSKHPFRPLAAQCMGAISQLTPNDELAALLKANFSDNHWEVREMAANLALEQYPQLINPSQVLAWLNDSSLAVVSVGIDALAKLDTADAAKMLQIAENIDSKRIKLRLLSHYSAFGSSDNIAQFKQLANEISGYDWIDYFDALSLFAIRFMDKAAGVEAASDLASRTGKLENWYVRLYGVEALITVFQATKSAIKADVTQSEVIQFNAILEEMLQSMHAAETDQRIKAVLNAALEKN